MNTTDKIMAQAEEFSAAACHVAHYDADRTTILPRSDAVQLLKQKHDTLRAKIEALVRDAERLDWMIFHSAKVRHSSDGEFCTVTWYDDEGQAHVTKPFGNARQAIDAAMQGKTT